MTVWVKVRSWHIEETSEHTMCGITVKAHPDLPAGERQANGWARELPLDEKSCETCMRLFLDRQFEEPNG